MVPTLKSLNKQPIFHTIACQEPLKCLLRIRRLLGVADRRHRCEYKADHQFDNGAHSISLRKRPIVVSLIISSRHNDA